MPQHARFPFACIVFTLEKKLYIFGSWWVLSITSVTHSRSTGPRTTNPHSRLDGYMHLHDSLIHFHDTPPPQVQFIDAYIHTHRDILKWGNKYFIQSLKSDKTVPSERPLSFCGLSRRDFDGLKGFETRLGPLGMTYGNLGAHLAGGSALVE